MYGLPRPEIKDFGTSFRITIYRKAFDTDIFGVKNPAVHTHKSGGLREDSAVYGQNSGGLFLNQEKPGVLIQNILDWNVIESRCNQNNFNITTIEKMQLLYNNFLMSDQSFSALSVRKLIGCADSTARSLISKLKDMELLIPVQGKGKGVYRFKKNIEL